MTEKSAVLRKPDWLKIQLRVDGQYKQVEDLISANDLNTICISGSCPNKNECFRRGTATLMIMGNICTRHCKFCNVPSGKPLPLDPAEPQKVADTISTLKLKHCVLTSVDRDDLPDFGASHWAATILKAKELNPDTSIEALIPDFDGNKDFISIVAKTKPNIISHNLETVRRLTPILRSRARYDRSLGVLKHLYDCGIKTKSGIMVGVGESSDEVFHAMDDLLAVNCKILTIGQYMQPSLKHYQVFEYIHPDKFAEYKEEALERGFDFVESGPMVRSSYFAERHV